MSDPGGISQHEQALLDVVRVLAATMLELGATKSILHSRLTAIRHAAFAAGKLDGVATLDHLIDELFPPHSSPPKPSFRIV